VLDHDLIAGLFHTVVVDCFDIVGERLGGWIDCDAGVFRMKMKSGIK
jgi:hypothetical protein